MADFCGSSAGGGGGAGPRAGVLGDFLDDFEEIEPLLEPFHACKLGICEGHGTGVIAKRDADGIAWFVHVALEDFPPKRMPKPKKIPPLPPGGVAVPSPEELLVLLRRADLNSGFDARLMSHRLSRVEDVIQSRSRELARNAAARNEWPPPSPSGAAPDSPVKPIGEPLPAELPEVVRRFYVKARRDARTMNADALEELAAAIREMRETVDAPDEQTKAAKR